MTTFPSQEKCIIDSYLCSHAPASWWTTPPPRRAGLRCWETTPSWSRLLPPPTSVQPRTSTGQTLGWSHEYSLVFPYCRFQLGIARKYRVAGRVSCCYTSGCNKDIFSAMGSVETQAVPSPSEAFQTRPLLQVRDFQNMEIN